MHKHTPKAKMKQLYLCLVSAELLYFQDIACEVYFIRSMGYLLLDILVNNTVLTEVTSHF